MSKDRRMSQTAPKVYDLIISGAGIPGASLAIGAARQGLSVALIDRRVSLIGTGDTRTSAFLPESIAFLRDLGLWQGVADAAQPLTTMMLMDDRDEKRDAPKSLPFRPESGSALAYNLPNATLAAVQAERLATLEGKIAFLGGRSLVSARQEGDMCLVELSEGTQLQARLVVGADGACSPLRDALGIGWRGFSDHQTALTARLRHAKLHGGISTEFHRHSGPMTFVPVAGDGHDSALVWCLPNAQAQAYAALEDKTLLAKIDMASRGTIGPITGLSNRGAFPVRPGIAQACAVGSFALIAEAAHVLPPLLAQGLNLSIKDAEVLLAAMDAHGPGAMATKAYAANRRADVLARLGVSEGLNQFLSHAPDPLARAYDAGMDALAALPLARLMAVRLGQRGIADA